MSYRVGRDGKLQVGFNDEAYQQTKKYFSFFALISNGLNDANEALEQYSLEQFSV